MGPVVPVEGYLDVQLLTETKFATGGRTVSRNHHFQVAERWSVPIHAIEVSIDGAVYKLPFRRIYPNVNSILRPMRCSSHACGFRRWENLDAIDPFVRLLRRQPRERGLLLTARLPPTVWSSLSGVAVCDRRCSTPVQNR